MGELIKLPDAEFEVMKVVWEAQPPITTRMIMDQLGKRRKWKMPALITLLTRLTERGYLRSEKQGKERHYYPLINREAYFRFETANFFHRVHSGSLASLMMSLNGGQSLGAQDRSALLAWLREEEIQ